MDNCSAHHPPTPVIVHFSLLHSYTEKNDMSLGGVAPSMTPKTTDSQCPIEATQDRLRQNPPCHSCVGVMRRCNYNTRQYLTIQVCKRDEWLSVASTTKTSGLAIHCSSFVGSGGRIPARSELVCTSTLCHQSWRSKSVADTTSRYRLNEFYRAA